MPSAGISLGTVTASATQTYTGTAGSQANGTYRFEVFKQPAQITGIRVYCTAAAGGGVTGITLAFTNGTATGSTAAHGTYTNITSVTAPAVGTFVDATISAVVVDSHGVVVAAQSPSLFLGTNGEITMINTATGTASGSALGSYSIDVLWNNEFTV
ncbi:MAG: hypothetical protein KGI27_09910 [Thaumarchaeota archaeon]|nr:hypothetical protein [Nitrososphaerota archaeon]